MTSAHIPSNQSAAGGLKVGIGVVAILALVALSGLDGGPAADRSGPQASQQVATPQAQPVFDGRGKWGGYAR